MNQHPVDVCLASVYFYPAYAGPAVRFHRYEPGLRERGIKMRVLTTYHPTDTKDVSGDNSLNEKDMLPLDYIGEIPVQRVQVANNVFGHRQQVLDQVLLSYVRRPGNRPDVIQLLNLPSIYNILLLQRSGIPFVFTCTMVSDLSENLLRRIALRWWLWLRHQFVDWIVVSSSVMLTALRDLGITTRIRVIPNGVDTNRFHPVNELQEKMALRAQLGLPLDGELIVFVGSITHRKGIDVLIDAWRIIAKVRPTAKLVLVGPGYGDVKVSASTSPFEAQIGESLLRSGAQDRVIFTGTVSNVEAYLQVADLFVFPSRREGMPNVVPEAFACGVATVMTPFLGLPQEFGKPGEHYELVERTPEALAAAVTTLLNQPERCGQLGTQARNWVQAELGVTNSLNNYAVLYQELAQRSRKFKQS